MSDKTGLHCQLSDDQPIEDDVALLNDLMVDMATQDTLYKPTGFWADRCEKIANAIRRDGLQTFRSNQEIVKGSGYAPVFPQRPLLDDKSHKKFDSAGPPLSTKQWNILNAGAGKNHAKYLKEYARIMDYHARVLYGWLATGPVSGRILETVRESKVGQPHMLQFGDRAYSPHFLRRLCQVALLCLGMGDKPLTRVLEIGGGFGTVPEILLKLRATERGYFVAVDIPPLLYLQSQYLKSIFGEIVLDYRVFREKEFIEEKDVEGKIVVLPSWMLPKLNLHFDCFYNSMSFQEMEPPVVDNYLDVVSSITESMFICSLTKGHHHRLQETNIPYERIETAITKRGFKPVQVDRDSVEGRVFSADLPDHQFGLFAA